MDKTNALQKLLNGTASEEEITLLKQLLANGEISIGGNVSNSVIIQGSENNVQVFQLTPEMLELLGGHKLLGNLERDLNGDEVVFGLQRLEAELPLRAPVLIPQFQEQARRLRPTLKTNPNALSESARKERLEALAHVNGLCMEALDISFNAVAIGEALPEYEARCPFRGLESFRVEDREFFFGREELTKKLTVKIQTHPFLAVLGASGSGKSSLVMAGVLPALDLDYAVIRPGTNPLDALDSVRGKSLVVVDQFEELFTLIRDEKTRADFISALLGLTKDCKVIITLRSDFMGEVATNRSLNDEVQNHLENVPPMNTDELHRAMDGQARWARLGFEADLSQQILDDVAGEPGAMPLLQHALWELWNRRHGRHLRAHEYRAFGGVKQAITSTAEKVYGDCSKPEQEQVRDIFLRLTRLDESDEGRDTRRRVPLGDLIPSGTNAASISALLDRLADARLIVKTVNGDVTEIEVAHEALIRHWERLRIWLNEDRDNLRLRESVSESAKEWEKSGKHESLLNFRWVKLDEALLLAQDSRYRMTDVEQAYLKGCVALRNREQRERERRLRYTVFASIAAAIIFLVLGGFGWAKSNEAERQAATAQANANAAAVAQIDAELQAKVAFARQLNIQAQSLLTGAKQEISILLAVQSMQLLPTDKAGQILQESTLGSAVSRVSYGASLENATFSPDGKYVASGGCDEQQLNVCIQGSVRVWDAATGREYSRITFDGIVETVDFSPDGKYVVSGGCDWVVSNTKDNGSSDMVCVRGNISVWDYTKGVEISRMKHGALVKIVDFSPDGKHILSGGCEYPRVISYCSEGSARVWNVVTGEEVLRITYDGEVNAVAFSSDGRYVVTGGCEQQLEGSCVLGSIRVWDLFSKEELTHTTPDGEVTSVAFSSDNKFFVSGAGQTIQVWSVTTGVEISRAIHNSWVNAVMFSPDDKYIASSSSDDSVRIWDAMTGEEISRMSHDDNVYSLDFSPNGKYIVSGSEDNTARVWDVRTGDEIARMTHNAWVSTVAFSPDNNRVVSGGEDNTAIVWNIDTTIAWDIDMTGEKDHVIYGGAANSVAFSPDSKYVASGGSDGFIYLWNLETEEKLTQIAHGYSVYSVEFSPNGAYIVSTGEDNSIRVWNTTSGQEISHMKHDSSVYSASATFSFDGKYIVSGSSDRTARVWDAITGGEIARMMHDGQVDSVAFSPDGKYIVSGSADNTLRIWVAMTGDEVFSIKNDDDITSVAFSPDGKYFVSGSFDNTARVWEAVTGEEVARMPHDDNVLSVAFSPDGWYVVTGSFDNTARVWEAATGEEVARMTHEDSVHSVAFSPDGKYVVSVGSDLTARVWNATTGTEVARMLHSYSIASVAFSPDGKYVVSGSSDQTVHIWLYRPEDLIADVCSHLTRNLTHAEWTQYIGDILPYQATCPNLPIEP